MALLCSERSFPEQPLACMDDFCTDNEHEVCSAYMTQIANLGHLQAGPLI